MDEDDPMYKFATQELIDGYASIHAEFGDAPDTMLDAAQLLYESHGPFELEFPNHAFDGHPDWGDD